MKTNTQKQTEHTPGIVSVGSNAYGMPVIRDSLARVVFTTSANPSSSDHRAGSPYRHDVAQSNAERLATCWNTHDELLEACKGLYAAAEAIRTVGNIASLVALADAAAVAEIAIAKAEGV